MTGVQFLALFSIIRLQDSVQWYICTQNSNYYNKRYDSLVKGSAVDVLGGVSGPLCRSIISKTVPLEDVGMFHDSDSILSLYLVS
jgi:hypothetical protein